MAKSNIQRAALVREAHRALLSRWRVAALCAALSFFGALAVLVVTTWQLHAATDDWEASINEGSYVFVATSSEGAITAARCDQLLGVDGIHAAGAVMGGRAATIATASDAAFLMQFVTPGYISVAFPDATAAPGAALGASTAMLTGGAAGGYLSEVGAITTIPVGFAATTIEPRVPGVERAILVPSLPLGTVNECLVEADPQHRDAVEQLLLSWFAPGKAWTVLPIVPPDYSTETPRAMPLILALAPAAGLVTAVFVAVTHWARRADYALYRLLGWRRSHLLTMILWESSATVGVAASAGLMLGLAVSAPLDVATIFRPLLAVAIAEYALVLSAIPALLLVVATRSSLVDALKGA